VKFDPSLPQDGINVSRTHPLREALLLVLGVIAVAAAIAATLAVVVDFAAPRIPVGLEARLFSGWIGGEVESDEQVAPREQALATLLDRMARHWPENPYAFRLAIWEAPEANAVALPGGLIAVTTGLLANVTSENELAFVLGHELGHFRNRDHLRGLGRGLAFSLVLVALGFSGSGSAVQLATIAGQFTQRGFDREQENQADRFGLALVTAEYGHAAGAIDLFGHLAEPDDALVGELSSYLSTHPVHADRIDDLRATARAAGWSLRGERRPLPEALVSAAEPASD
jgi:Zn-dependent protease with chaperone function